MSQELATKLVACPQWRWMPGMAWVRNAPGAQSLSSMQGRCASQMDCDQMPSSMIPDLTDAATVGCLLAMLGASLLSIGSALPAGWLVLTRHGGDRVHQNGGATLGEAVARALLAVWGAR